MPNLWGDPVGNRPSKHASMSLVPIGRQLYFHGFSIFTQPQRETQQEMPTGSPVLFQLVLLIRLTDSLVFSQKVTIPITCCLPSLQELLGAFSSVSWQIFWHILHISLEAECLCLIN